jgi:hypothetical protein
LYVLTHRALGYLERAGNLIDLQARREWSQFLDLSGAKADIAI